MVKEDTGDLDESMMPSVLARNWAVALGFMVFRYIIFASMYAGGLGSSTLPAHGECRPLAGTGGATVTRDRA